MIKYLPILFFTLLLISCSKDKVIYSESFQIDANGWSYQHPIHYEFTNEDTLAEHQILLYIRYDEQFGFENLYTKMTTTMPNNNIVEDIVSLNINDSRGKSNGTCSNGICQVTLILEPSTKLMKGKYNIEINQYSRQDSIKNIKEIALKVIQLYHK